MFRGNVGAYQAALNHGWLDDYTWFQSPQKPYNYWTKARCAEESKKYKTRGEFHDKCGTAYGKARTNGWLDEFTWLKDERLDFHNDKIDCVYAYEFIELKSVYIGRTLMRRAKTRDKEHLFVDNDAVYLFAKENNIRVPSMKILENGLTLKEGKKKEGYYVEKYRNEGWTILNRTKTGSLGNIFVVKWTKKTCYNEAMKYKTRGDFAKFNGSAYDVARRNGWLNDYTWFEEMQKPSGYWEDYDNCYNAAKECKTKTEFIKKYSAAWVQARKRGWQNDYVWFNEVEKIAWNKKWNYDTVLEEAKKYKTRKEFGTKAHGAYKVAVKNGWLDSYDWFENTHEVLSRAIKASKKIKWTYDVCREIALKTKSRHEFRQKSNGAYIASWQKGWLDDFFPPKKKESSYQLELPFSNE